MNKFLSISPFARHYSGNRQTLARSFFIFLMLLRCFTSHGSHTTYPTAYRHMCFTHVGFPIRTSPDQSLFTSSPRRFVGYHVLHRLIVPRHPPYTLFCFILTFVWPKSHQKWIHNLIFDKQFATTIFTLGKNDEQTIYLDAMFTLMQSLTLKIFDLLTIIHILIGWISECDTTIQFAKCLVATKV